MYHPTAAKQVAREPTLKYRVNMGRIPCRVDRVAGIPIDAYREVSLYAARRRESVAAQNMGKQISADPSQGDANNRLRRLRMTLGGHILRDGIRTPAHLAATRSRLSRYQRGFPNSRHQCIVTTLVRDAKPLAAGLAQKHIGRQMQYRYFLARAVDKALR
jgi:hypothetical protein